MSHAMQNYVWDNYYDLFAENIDISKKEGLSSTTFVVDEYINGGESEEKKAIMDSIFTSLKSFGLKVYTTCINFTPRTHLHVIHASHCDCSLYKVFGLSWKKKVYAH